MTVLPNRQLVVLRFGPEASFEGGLLGVVERIESGMSLRVLDILFLHKDAAGDLQAMSTRGGGAGGVASAVLDFRLDERARREVTARTLADRPDLVTLGETIDRGDAIVAFLVEHRWADALSQAVERMGGEVGAAEFVSASSLRELPDRLLEISGGSQSES